MKKTISFLCFLLAYSFSFAQQTKDNDCSIVPFDVALNDSSESNSNIRANPNEEIILELNHQRDYFTLTVVGFKDGWLKINNIESVNFGYKISELEGWIHYSIVGVSARRDLKLQSEPNSKKIIGTIEQEVFGIKIKDICSNWVRVEYEGISGWIESEWLCGSPVTTCP